MAGSDSETSSGTDSDFERDLEVIRMNNECIPPVVKLHSKNEITEVT